MDVIIIGGGISGLSAAYELERRGISFTLLEASPRLGGLIRTEYLDGFTVERRLSTIQWNGTMPDSRSVPRMRPMRS